jgi:hypothetical protein
MIDRRGEDVLFFCFYFWVSSHKCSWREERQFRTPLTLPLHFPPWIQMHPHQFSVTWGVPWDADLVILSIALVKTSLFTTLNYQFPFWETLSHDGVRRRLEASSTHSRSGIASASHNIALQGKASCAAAQRLSEEPRIMQ